MSAEPTKVENQPAGEAAAAASAEPATQPAESKPEDSNPAAAENAAAGSADAPTESKPATETTAPAAVAEETGTKDEAKEEPKTENKDEKSKEEAPKETPLTKLAGRLGEIKKNADHGEMWGVALSGLDHAPTAIVLQKYLRANDNDVALAEKQLASALEWRKKNNPTALLDEKVYDRSKFGDLGFVTEHKDDKGKRVVITWNVYGAVKDNKATFGNLKEFLDWRVALMEFGTRKLNINEATAPIPDGEEDPYRMVQVHDYLSVAFLRMDPHIKAASKETIQTLSMAYPELLAHKYFVNVPTIMSWAFSAMKLFLSPATLRKFHPLSSGSSLATEMPAYTSSLPKEYGGSGPSVKEGLTVKLTDAPAPAEGNKSDKPAAAAAESGPKKDEAPKEEPKPEEVKEEEAKPEEPKPEEPKPEEPKPEEPKTKEAKPEETKPEETKPEETKPEETKPEETPAKDEATAESKDAETKAQ